MINDSLGIGILIDRYPLNSPWVRSWLRRWILPLWFAMLTVTHLAFVTIIGIPIGLDTRVYQAAAQAWLGGIDPWSVSFATGSTLPGVQFAGPPMTLIPFAVLSWMPVDVLVMLVVLSSAASAIWLCRRLGLPVYWLLFPPIADSIWFGNVNLFVVSLLVLGGTVGATIATTLKVYAFVPLLVRRRYRESAAAFVVIALTAWLLPWSQFISGVRTTVAVLAAQSWGGQDNPLTGPLIVAATLAAIVLLGRERGAWLAVPVLWPSTQLHYSVLAMPVFATVPALALAGAVPAPGVLGLAVVVYAIWDRRLTIRSVLSRFNETRRRRPVSEADPGAPHESPPGAQLEPARSASPPAGGPES